jgi:hypothetical protein
VNQDRGKQTKIEDFRSLKGEEGIGSDTIHHRAQYSTIRSIKSTKCCTGVEGLGVSAEIETEPQREKDTG